MAANIIYKEQIFGGVATTYDIRPASGKMWWFKECRITTNASITVKTNGVVGLKTLFTGIGGSSYWGVPFTPGTKIAGAYADPQLHQVQTIVGVEDAMLVSSYDQYIQLTIANTFTYGRISWLGVEIDL